MAVESMENDDDSDDGGIGPLPGGLTNYCPSVLDTVGWVIWPLKIVPNMTYNVFGGTLNPTLLLVMMMTMTVESMENDDGSDDGDNGHWIHGEWWW